MVQRSEFLATDPEVPGSVHIDTRFFLVVVVLERGPLSLVRINKELFESESRRSGLGNRD
jgi:hypothetical protein